ncbi:hypothetical protein HPB50_028025 [Hyalomma asiaticum]|nr:hypothetical protein HPB50_028025 [Hyalomma asiaticum]
MFVFEIRPAKCVRCPGLRFDPACAKHTLQASRRREEFLRKALQRKDVEVEPPADHTPLIEAVLAQTAPLRMSAHMAAEFM